MFTDVTIDYDAEEAHAGALGGRLEGRIDAIGLPLLILGGVQVRHPQIIQSS